MGDLPSAPQKAKLFLPVLCAKNFAVGFFELFGKRKSMRLFCLHRFRLQFLFLRRSSLHHFWLLLAPCRIASPPLEPAKQAVAAAKEQVEGVHKWVARLHFISESYAQRGPRRTEQCSAQTPSHGSGQTKQSELLDAMRGLDAGEQRRVRRNRVGNPPFRCCSEPGRTGCAATDLDVLYPAQAPCAGPPCLARAWLGPPGSAF